MKDFIPGMGTRSFAIMKGGRESEVDVLSGAGVTICRGHHQHQHLEAVHLLPAQLVGQAPEDDRPGGRGEQGRDDRSDFW